MYPAGDPSWKVLRLLFSRSWFTRIWTVQELAVARSVKVRCGDNELSWDEVENAACYIDIHEYGGHQLGHGLGCHFPSLLEKSAIPTSGCLAMSSIRDQVQRAGKFTYETKCGLLELLEAIRP